MNRLRELAEKTPAGRERYVDFLRAFSIVVVVLGHWVTALIQWKSNSQIAGVFNVVGVTPWGWLGTWIFQVMPVFFFVGGFSNKVSLDKCVRKGEPIYVFLINRLFRLMKPTVVFLLIWLTIYVVLRSDFLWKISFLKELKNIHFLWVIAIQPLWFLGVYIGVVALSPLLLELHHRYKLEVVLVIVVLIAFVDLLRFGVRIPGVGWANFAFVWLLAHQLGFFYADGSLTKSPPRIHWLLALGGLAGMVVLTNIGIYPRSMVGTGFDEISNMSPPNITIVMLIFWQVGVIMLLRAPLNRWLAKTKPWIAVILANWKIMTLYLWHLTAYTIAFGLLRPLGFGNTGNTLSWWLERPVWVLLPALILSGMIFLFGSFERAGRTSWVRPLRLFLSR